MVFSPARFLLWYSGLELPDCFTWLKSWRKQTRTTVQQQQQQNNNNHKQQEQEQDNSRRQKGNNQLIILFSISWDCRIYSTFCFVSVGVPNFYVTYKLQNNLLAQLCEVVQYIVLLKKCFKLKSTHLKAGSFSVFLHHNHNPSLLPEILQSQKWPTVNATAWWLAYNVSSVGMGYILKSISEWFYESCILNIT